ncbi:hypothetical protein DsansV1_C04g0037281 [Dioscorea sansibarensis]
MRGIVEKKDLSVSIDTFCRVYPRSYTCPSSLIFMHGKNNESPL